MNYTLKNKIPKGVFHSYAIEEFWLPQKTIFS